MTDFGVHKAYTARVHSVCTILAVVLCVSGAQAGAWEEFERRCLVPMENIESSIVSGLDLTAHVDRSYPDAEVFTHSDGAFSIVRRTADAGGEVCGLVVERASDAFLKTFELGLTGWFETALAGDRYERVFEWSHGVTFQSTTWREPKMKVVINVPVYRDETGRSTSTVLVKETDLES